MKTLGELLFRLGPANLRAKLGLSLSVVEDAKREWSDGMVSETTLARKGYGEDYLCDNALTWMRRRMFFPDKYSFVFKRAIVELERGRVMVDGKWLVESFGNPVNAPCEVIFLRLFAWLFKLLGKYKKLPDNEGRGYVYCRNDGYAHFVAESLVPVIYSLKLRPSASVVVSKRQYVSTSYFRQYMELLKAKGLIHDIIEVNAELIDVPEYVMTGFETDAGSICSQSVEVLREALLPKDERPGWRSIFLTRRGSRCFDNQAALEKIASDSGFEIIDADGMSVESQIRLFSEVKTLVANHGAGLTNMIYMSPGGKVLELFSEGCKNDFFFRLSSIMKHEYDCMLANGSYGWGEVPEEAFRQRLIGLAQR